MKWQPIKTAPLDGTHMLVWVRQEEHQVEIAFYDPHENSELRGWVRVAGDDYMENTPDYWMPLPPPPEVET
jgi:hypothetical protein